MPIYAKCIAASIYNGIPVYSLEVQAPKFLDAEFEKHRMLSSNSSSSRAIPFRPLDEIFLPKDIRKNQKGMQGYEQYEDPEDFINSSLALYHSAITVGEFWKSRIHKQHLNRYIEPWMYQRKIVTATEWNNFFDLRLAPDAQPEMQELARCMKEAIDNAICVELEPGEWHLPYVTTAETFNSNEDDFEIHPKIRIKASVARCARVSYNNLDNTKPSIEKDLALYDKLLSSKHFSCFEHQVTPMLLRNSWEFTYSEGWIDWEKGVTHMDRHGDYWSGNMRGWIQYRQTVQSWNQSYV